MCIPYLSGKGLKSKKIKSNCIITASVCVLLICCCLSGLAVNLYDSHICNDKNRIAEELVTNAPEQNGIKSKVRLQKPRKISANLNEMSHKILKRGTSLQLQMNQENTIYEILYDFDMEKQSISIPERCVLKFEGGCFSNGKLNGHNTGIIAQDVTIFDSVTIDGTWDVPVITSKWFKCVNDNDIVQAFNLLSDDIQNTITIESREKDYWVDCQKGGTLANPVGILNLKSNTKCIVNGTIRQRGHHSGHIHLFLLYEVENVVLEGSGTIYGEKKLHDYSGVSPILPGEKTIKRRLMNIIISSIFKNPRILLLEVFH